MFTHMPPSNLHNQQNKAASISAQASIQLSYMSIWCIEKSYTRQSYKQTDKYEHEPRSNPKT